MATLRAFPKAHLLLAATLAGLILTLLGTAWIFPGHGDVGRTQPAVPGNTERLAQTAAGAVAEQPPGNARGEAAPRLEASARGRAEPLSADENAGHTVKVDTVRSGDSMARIFRRQSLSPRTLQAVLDSGEPAERLRRIHPGHELEFALDGDGRLMRLTYRAGPTRGLEVERGDDGFEAREIEREPQRVLRFREGTIRSSLFAASHSVGLNDAMTVRLAQIFQWDIDFVLDIRAGDSFSLLYEEHYLDGELIGFGRILAAEFTNRGRHYRAVRYTDSSGETSYFTPDGKNMRKTFLRAPVEFTRISSNFDPGRLHPIHNKVVPHRGIDYAAPTGTPIMAAGDGRVRTARRTPANGNYVVLQHGEQFRTKYLHMSRFARGIRPGVEVAQGQVIGYVGSTGLATGPHLHYEFLVDGVHRNPRTVDLPDAEPVPEQEIDRFRAHTAPLLAMLDSEQQLLQLARRR